MNLLGLSPSQLEAFCSALEEPRFRATQLMKWIYHRGCTDLMQMSDVRLSSRILLASHAHITLPEMCQEQVSSDGTIKWLFRLEGGFIESVYIPEQGRGTLCVSSQAGCPLGCRFCATGQGGFKRHLTCAEIVGQVWFAANRLHQWQAVETRPITNIVFMGMGEPLLNLEAVIPAITLLLDDCGFGFSKRRVVLSTSGIAPGITALGQAVDVALALSLHAPDDALRSTLMPINRRYPIQTVLAAVKHYLEHSTANPDGVTIEYVMLSEINDAPEQAEALVRCLQGVPSKINLIPWNPIAGSAYHPSSAERIEAFAQRLRGSGWVVMVRKNRGEDIAAACGQLSGHQRLEA